MPHKKKTSPKKGTAKTQTDPGASSETQKISPPRGFTPQDDEKLQELTSGIQASTHQNPSLAIKEVLNVLKVVEQQFDKLRDEQQKQEATYDELIQKIHVVEKAESFFHCLSVEKSAPSSDGALLVCEPRQWPQVHPFGGVGEVGGACDGQRLEHVS